MLGRTPSLGRDFTAEDARHGQPLLLIAFEAWQRYFGGDPAIVGRTLWRNEQPAEIVGVLPPGFVAPPNQFVMTSDGLMLDARPTDVAASTDRWSPPYVRLAPGVPVAQAEEELQIIAERALAAGLVPAVNASASLRLIPIGDFMFGRYRQYAWLVFGAASLVLLVACANLTGLLLVRGRSRERLAATRMALGASPWRLVRAAAVESLCLRAAACAVALLVLVWSTEAVRLMLPPTFAHHAVPLLDSRVVAFAILMVVATAAAVSILPAWRLRRLDLLAVMQGTHQAGRHRRVAGSAVLIVEAALGVILVLGGVATSRTLLGLLHTDLGFDPTDLYYVNATLPEAPTAEIRYGRYEQVLESIAGIPGVRAAAAANVLPLSGVAGWTSLGEGYPSRDSRERAYRSHVTGGYFEALGQPLLAGRTISRDDVRARSRVGVLNLSGLWLVWPGVGPGDAIGRWLEFPGEPPIEVIGVVADLRPTYPVVPDAYLYMPITPDDMRFMMYAVRMAPGQMPDLADLRERIGRDVVSPRDATVISIADRLHTSVRDERFRAVLFSAFGVVALVLAAVGLYVICAFEVAVRRHELGIRAALGATGANLRRIVIAEALRPAAAGVAIGLVVAWWVATLLQSFLRDVDARDPWMLAFVAAVLVLTSVVAAWIPASRAARVEPARVLRAI